MVKLLSIIKSDLISYQAKNPLSVFLTFFFNMSFRLVLNYRIGHYLHINRNPLFSLLILWLKKRQIKKYGCDISYQCNIGINIKFPHPLGIVIGNGAIIKNNVMIWQNVTLGSIGNENKSYPTIENNVKLYANSQILGNITVSENAKVGASSVLLTDLPENKTAVGIPAKIL